MVLSQTHKKNATLKVCYLSAPKKKKWKMQLTRTQGNILQENPQISGQDS